MEHYDSYDARHPDAGHPNMPSPPTFHTDATRYPPLVRPTPSYPRAYEHVLNHHPDPNIPYSYHPQGIYAHQVQEPVAIHYDVNQHNPSWDNVSIALANSVAGMPALGYAEGPAQDVLRATAVYQQHQMHSDPSQVYPAPSRPSQHASFSPQVFNHPQHHILSTASGPSSKSGSPSPTASRLAFSGDNNAPQTHPASAYGLATGPRGVHRPPEPTDQPWNLKPYDAPFGRPRIASSGTASGPHAVVGGTVPGASGPGVFLRSPTPTKRQRTNQACEKCRDRKAKCNGARPSCQRCSQRGLPCEYAKERRMRGPNRTGSGHNAGGNRASPASPHKGSASPARGSAASLHSASPSDAAGASTSAAAAHRQRQLSGNKPMASPQNLAQRLPVYRTIHVTQSNPDFHKQQNSAGQNSKLGSSMSSSDSSTSVSRPRSNTASYPLVNGSTPNPVHLFAAIRTDGNFSSSDASEPQSATSSSFGVDAHAAFATAAAGHYPVPDQGDEYPSDATMEYPGDGGVVLGAPMGMLGIHGDASGDVALRPALQNAHGLGPGPVFADSPMDVGDNGNGGDANWQFHLNVDSSFEPRQRFSTMSTGSASVSSNPSTSSPGPYLHRTVSYHNSGASVQDNSGWSHGSATISAVPSPPIAHSTLPIPLELSTVDFPISSPKDDDPTRFSGGLPIHLNYPWSTEQDGDGVAHGVASMPRATSVIRTGSDEFSSWIQDNPEGHQTKGSANGSPHSASDAAAGNIRSVTVLEVRD